MRFATVAVLSALAAVASAVNQTVAVGMNGTLTFTPNNVNASSGDTINFVFMSKNQLVDSFIVFPKVSQLTGFQHCYPVDLWLALHAEGRRLRLVVPRCQHDGPDPVPVVVHHANEHGSALGLLRKSPSLLPSHGNLITDDTGT